MATPTLESLRSPFIENVFSRGQDNKPLKQAFYHTAANLFVILACCAAVAVYFILEAFLRPLLWAVLCGTFLHPFKNTLTSLLRGWLQTLRNSGTPLLIGTALLPWQVLDNASERLSTFLQQNLKLIIAATIGLPLAYLIYHFGPLWQMFACLKAVFMFVYDTLEYFSAIWVFSTVAAYTIVVIFFWTPNTSVILKPLAVPVWVTLGFYLASAAGPLRVPLVLFIVILVVVGGTSEIKDFKKNLEEQGGDKGVHALLKKWHALLKKWFLGTKPTESNEDQEGDQSSISVADKEEDKSEVNGGALSENGKSAENETPEPVTEDEPPALKPQSLMGTKASKAKFTNLQNEAPQKKERTLVDMCFIALIWALLLVRIWVHFWLIQLLPILLVFLGLKKLGLHVTSWQKVKCLVSRIKTTVTTDKRIEILAPAPIRGLGKIILRGDNKVVGSLERSLDQTISILIVLLLLVGSILGTFFMVVQIHKESMHIVSVSSNVFNTTMHPEMTQWLPDHEELKKHIDSMVGNAYLYGRQWIADKLHSALSGDDASKTRVEKQVLDLWDRIYENYFAPKNATLSISRQLVRQVSMPDLRNVTNMWDIVTMAQNFNLDIVEFARENVGTFVQVIDSVWLLLKGNISLMLSILTALISLVLGGGTAILNFVLSFVIFITTLFYLLASSGKQYKPVEWFSRFSPSSGPRGQGSKFGNAVEEAISSVFLASLKMGAFYGLYTWLTHTIFGIQIVFIPSALAAIFGAIPFVGTYFAALPAVIELWLVNGQKFQAVALVCCHLLPMFFVDTAIYSEVKGGHPYLTGLAIAGGMYWMGLAGAILGPILLCCLIVAVNVYSTVLSSESSISPMTPSNADKKKVTFSLQRGFSLPDALESDR